MGSPVVIGSFDDVTTLCAQTGWSRYGVIAVGDPLTGRRFTADDVIVLDSAVERLELPGAREWLAGLRCKLGHGEDAAVTAKLEAKGVAWP